MKRFSQSPRAAAFVQDPYPFYDMARATGPFFDWEDYGFPCAAGHVEVNALLRDRRFGRELPGAPRPPVPEHLRAFRAVDDLSMLDREPPDHTRLRRLVLRDFTARRIAALGPEIAALSRSLVDDLGAPEFDLLGGFAECLPVLVIARLLGVPEAACADLLAWSHDMVAMYQARRDRAVELKADAAAAAFSAYLRALVAARWTRPGDDLISKLVAARAGHEALDEDEIVATCILLLNAGHEATVHVIGNGVKALLDSGLDALAVLGDPVAAAATVEEMLRFDAPLHLFTRIALEDVEAFGHRFRRGETVGCLLAAANRDPAVFAMPHSFDPRRGNAGAHLSFGAGIHFCLGAPLARLELVTALPILFSRWPRLRIAAEPRFADRYHFRGLEALILRSGQ